MISYQRLARWEYLSTGAAGRLYYWYNLLLIHLLLAAGTILLSVLGKTKWIYYENGRGSTP